MEKLMGKYITKKQQVLNLLNDIEATITSRNADIAIPILKWTQEKIRLDTVEKNRHEKYQSTKYRKYRPRAVKQWEVYGCALGKNIGSEQNGVSRPVVIVQDTRESMHSPTVLVAPFTSAYDKDGNKKRKLDTQVEFLNDKMTKASYIKVEHARCISKSRLTEKMCDLDENTISEIKEKIKLVYNL